MHGCVCLLFVESYFIFELTAELMCVGCDLKGAMFVKTHIGTTQAADESFILLMWTVVVSKIAIFSSIFSRDFSKQLSAFQGHMNNLY